MAPALPGSIAAIQNESFIKPFRLLVSKGGRRETKIPALRNCTNMLSRDVVHIPVSQQETDLREIRCVTAPNWFSLHANDTAPRRLSFSSPLRRFLLKAKSYPSFPQLDDMLKTHLIFSAKRFRQIPKKTRR